VNTKEETASNDAYQQISYCCQTVAEMEPVFEYIKLLEEKIAQLEEELENGRA